MQYTTMTSPLGELLLAGEAGSLAVIGFPEGRDKIEPRPNWEHADEPFAQATTQLAEYFDGRRTCFELELSPTGTPFQLAVLKALQDIPYGETRSYGDIARQVGRPKAVRAVGAANGRNPLPIVIPCHRVLGSDGSLTGFGGGLPAKRFLLDLESGASLF